MHGLHWLDEVVATWLVTKVCDQGWPKVYRIVVAFLKRIWRRTRMIWKPAMHAIMWTTDNFVRATTPFMHEVTYNPNKQLQIIHHATQDTGWENRWQVRLITAGKCGAWLGKFTTAEEAYLATV